MNGPPCNGSTFLGQVTLLVADEVCQYENGILTTNNSCDPFGHYFSENGSYDPECIDFFQNCLPSLVSLINDNVQSLACRQWDQDYLNSVCSTTGHLYRTGGLSIGTAGSTTARLTVKDGIITDKVKVESCGALQWCDYVFEDGYALPTLEQVQSFIEQYKHLPNMPAGSTIEQEGSFDLKEITLLQQEKIEEIFLYLIALEKEIDRLETTLDHQNH